MGRWRAAQPSCLGHTGRWRGDCLYLCLDAPSPGPPINLPTCPGPVSPFSDRAAERRQGLNPDYLDLELGALGAAASASAGGGVLASAPDAGRPLTADETKYLGGDVDHTHLVRGLDYALLQKAGRKSGGTRRNELDVVGMARAGGVEGHERPPLTHFSAPPALPTRLLSGPGRDDQAPLQRYRRRRGPLPARRASRARGVNRSSLRLDWMARSARSTPCATRKRRHRDPAAHIVSSLEGSAIARTVRCGAINTNAAIVSAR